MLNIMKLREVTPEERINLLKMSLLTFDSEERLLVEKLFALLAKVIAHSEENKMKACGLGITFATVIFVAKDACKRQEQIANMFYFPKIVELFIASQ